MSVVKSLLATSLAFGLVSLIGCSSSNNNTPVDTTPPVISNLSHIDNQKVIGSRTISFSMDATDETALSSVTITHNGASQTVTNASDNYSASITLEDRTNNVIVVTANDADNATTQTITLDYPFLSFTNGQPASVSIGQPDLESRSYNQGGSIGANTLADAAGTLVVNGVLYIADGSNHRVLGFNSIPTTNNMNADFVLGQVDFVSNVSDLSNTGITRPDYMAYDNGHFFVLHRGFSDSRANHWSILPTDNTQAADFVIGQVDFGTGESFVCQPDVLTGSYSITTVANKVIIIDFYSRVLIWNSIPTASGASADMILGQTDISGCKNNDTDGDGVSELLPTASTLSAPKGVWSDGTRLVVADAQNNRVLIWNTFPTVNGQPADLVLGQVDFTTENTATITSTALKPAYIASNGNQLFISDQNSARILIWNSWPTTNNQAADRVLGANDFIGGITGLTDSALLSSGNSELTVIADKLLVTDSHRVLIFQAP